MFNVLIVDDDILAHRSLDAVISGKDGYQVAACVESGEEAVEFCKNHDIQLIFLDIALPGITGIETAVAISKISPSAQIVIISVLSGFEIIKKTLTSNVRDYLIKPVSFSEIVKILEDFQGDQEEDNDLSCRLLDYIYQRNYRGMVREIPEIVGQIFRSDSFGYKGLLARFLQIINHTLKTIQLYLFEGEAVSDETVMVRFPLNKAFVDKEIVWVFWLTDVMNAIYWKQMYSNHEYLKTVSNYIDREINNDISLSSICEACSISQSYLSKLFRRCFGISVMDYIHLRKLTKAKEYIALTDYTMTQIGYRIGYNDGSYFSKIFKKYEGMTPKQYKIAYNVTRKEEKKS